MAKAMSQHFMDARLIENAADPSSKLFKDRGIYILTPKGLHVLEQFIRKNGINCDHLQDVFITQPICIKLLHLERRSADDEIIVTQSVIAALFRRFVGRQPNYSSQTSQPQVAFQRYNERAKGVSLMEPLLGKGQQHHKYCFAAVTALEWLCDFTTVVREEAAEMAAQFVRFGLIILVSDKRKKNETLIIFTVRGSAPGGNSPVSQQGEFLWTAKAIYKITDEGRRVAHWDNLRGGAQDSPSALSANLNHERSSVDNNAEGEKGNDAKIHRRIALAEKLYADYKATEKKNAKESNPERLRYILEEPSLRSLFREFLRNSFCEENLSFWLDVQDFKRKFNITSSVNTLPRSGSQKTPGQAAMEHHNELLINTAFVIYNTYLAPSSQCELNIDHRLRNELVKYLEDAVTSFTGKSFQGRVEPEQASAFSPTQMQTMIRLYERIQVHVFRLIAMDSVPKFLVTRNWVEDFDPTDDDVRLLASAPSQPPGLNTEETGGAYITIYPNLHASKWEHRQQQQARALS